MRAIYAPTANSKKPANSPFKTVSFLLEVEAEKKLYFYSKL